MSWLEYVWGLAMVGLAAAFGAFEAFVMRLASAGYALAERIAAALR